MDAVQALRAARKPITEHSSSAKTGLYGIYAKDLNCLPDIIIQKTGIVYVGRTEGSLDARNHFLATNSGFHSPRRSLGAILKRKLDLVAIPRSPGPSPTNFKNYAFSGDGESRLSEWMHHNLDYAIVELEGALKGIERATISAMRPPLNLTGWPNPQRRQIMNLRSACKSEAKAARNNAG